MPTLREVGPNGKAGKPVKSNCDNQDWLDVDSDSESNKSNPGSEVGSNLTGSKKKPCPTNVMDYSNQSNKKAKTNVVRVPKFTPLKKVKEIRSQLDSLKKEGASESTEYAAKLKADQKKSPSDDNFDKKSTGN